MKDATIELQCPAQQHACHGQALHCIQDPQLQQHAHGLQMAVQRDEEVIAYTNFKGVHNAAATSKHTQGHRWHQGLLVQAGLI